MRFVDLCRNASLDQAEYYYHNGLISQVQYEAYCWLWRNCSFRYSSENVQ